MKTRIETLLEEAEIKKVDDFAKKTRTGRAEAVKKLIELGLERAEREDRERRVAEAYRNGKLTLRQCAELLGVDYYRMDQILSELGIPVSDLSGEEIEKAISR